MRLAYAVVCGGKVEVASVHMTPRLAMAHWLAAGGVRLSPRISNEALKATYAGIAAVHKQQPVELAIVQITPSRSVDVAGLEDLDAPPAVVALVPPAPPPPRGP